MYITVEASHEQIDKAKEIVKKLTFNFQSESFENPGSPQSLDPLLDLCLPL